MGFQEIKRAFFVAIWFVFLTFPIMVIRVDTIENVIRWRWERTGLIGIGTFLIAIVWNFFLQRRTPPGKKKAVVTVTDNAEFAETAATGVTGDGDGGSTRALTRARPGLMVSRIVARLRDRKIFVPMVVILGLLGILFPLITSLYQTNVIITALLYVMLALGLNIVIGLGGMLHLGYVAFYAVGAYSYALLNQYLGIGFWVALPIGAALSTIAGILLALPVLRLRGDYLAIVTLGFAEIVRIILNNATGFTGGPQGVGGIPRPPLFGLEMGLNQAITYTYYIIFAMVILTIFVVYRLENSRLGRAWVAMGEDDIASEAMGIDVMKTKVTAFALGSTWAGIAGVIFASRTTFVNPASFTVWESIIVLSCVVLGGMGSIPGVIVGALVLILVPEYLRAFADYRMLMFGAVLVIMMVFRPGGLIQKRRRAYTFDKNIDSEVSA
ncbi:MAG: ABC transporter permease subunit [Alkalispirochaetaceae bacterium]